MTVSPGTFTLASVGDVIIRRPASVLQDPGLQAAIAGTSIVIENNVGVIRVP